MIANGVQWCDSPAAVARNAEIVLSMISTPEVLKEISLGANGVLQALGKGNIHIDLSTVSPVATRQLAKKYHEDGKFFLHSPVLGSIPQAIEGTLLLFVGGEEETYKRSEVILKTLGTKTWRFDRVDQASYTKLLCNLFIAGMITTLVRAIVFANKADVNPRTLLEIISHSSLNAPMYQCKGSSIID